MWRIIQWSRELGRGRIGSPESAPLDFDASVALVDDFEIGEEVRIEVSRVGETWKVTRIEPAIGRFIPPHGPDSIAPLLRRELADEVLGVLGQVQLQEEYEVSSYMPAEITLRGSEGYVDSPPSDTLVFVDPVYVELPTRIWPQILRLADEKERRYLAARVDDLSSDHVAITIVDTDSRYFFIVCRQFRYLAADSKRCRS